MASILLGGKFRAFTNGGIPLVGGKLYSYRAGTSTLQATYTDKDEGSQNANPVILDANGEANVWLGENTGYAYKLVLKDPSDVIQWTTDKMPGGGVNDLSITTAKIADGAVTTVKVADGAITQAKLAAKPVGLQDVTFGTVTVTSPAVLSGTLSVIASTRPILVGLVGKFDTDPAILRIANSALAGAAATIEIYRNSTRISSQTFGGKRSQATQAFTTSGTYVVPALVTEIWVNAAGGGGGGGSGASGVGGGGGGGGSGIRMQKLSVTPGETLTITIGAAGVGGSYIDLTTPIPGGAGGDTTITSGSSVVIFRAKGGLGGAGATPFAGGVGWGIGGDGGQGGGGGGTSPGNPGQPLDDNAAVYVGGSGGGQSGGTTPGGGGGGGAGLLGSGGTGGVGRQSNPGTDGVAGTGYGSGGGGSGGSGDGSRSGQGKNGGGGYLELFDNPIGGSQEIYIPPSAISVVDTTGVAEAVSYTIQACVTVAGAALTASGEIQLQSVEL